MSEGGTEQKGRFKIKNVSKPTSEDTSGTTTPQSVTNIVGPAKAEETSVVIETVSAAEQSIKDNKSKDGTADIVSTLSIPVPGAVKKKSRFIVKTVAKEDDEDDREMPTPHTNPDSSKLRISGQSEDPSVVLAKMEQLMRSNMQIMSQMMDLTRSSLRGSTSSPGPLSAGIAMGHSGGFSVPGSPVLPPPGTPVSFSAGVQGGVNSLLRAATMGISAHADLPPLGQGPVSPAPQSTTLSTTTASTSAPASVVPHINTSLTLPSTIPSAGSAGTPTSAGDGVSHKSAFASGGSNAGTPTNAASAGAKGALNSNSSTSTIGAGDGIAKTVTSVTATANTSTASTNTITPIITTTNPSDDKDGQFNKMSHYLLEMKKEVEQAQKQRRERALETQRLREKCTQLEDKLTSSQRKCARLEEQQALHSGVVEALQAQIAQLSDAVSRQSAELERYKLNMVGDVPNASLVPIAASSAATITNTTTTLPSTTVTPPRFEVELPASNNTIPTTIPTATATAVPSTTPSLASAQNYSSDGSIQRMDSNNSTNNSVNNTNPALINNSSSSLNLEGYFLGTPPVSPPQALHKVVSGSAVHNTSHGNIHTHHGTLTQSTLFSHNQSQASGASPLPLPPPPNSSVIYAPHSSSASSISVTNTDTQQHPLVRTKSLNGSQTAPNNSTTNNNAGTSSNAGSYSQPSLMQQMMDMAVNNITSTSTNTNPTTNANNASNTNNTSNSSKQSARGAPPGSGYSSGTATPTYRSNSTSSAQPVMLNYPSNSGGMGGGVGGGMNGTSMNVNSGGQQQLQGQGGSQAHNTHSHHTLHTLAPLPQHTQHHHAQHGAHTHHAHAHAQHPPHTHANTLAPHAQHAQHMHANYSNTLPNSQPSTLPNPHHLTPLAINNSSSNAMSQHNPLLPHVTGAFSQYNSHTNTHPSSHTNHPTHTTATNNGLTLQYTPTYAQDQQRMYAGTPTNGNTNNQTGTGSPAFPTNPLNTFGVQGSMMYANTPNAQNMQGSTSGSNSNSNSNKYPSHAERESSGNIHAHVHAPQTHNNMHNAGSVSTQTGSNRVVHDDLDSIAARPNKPADHDFLSIDNSAL